LDSGIEKWANSFHSKALENVPNFSPSWHCDHLLPDPEMQSVTGSL